MSHITQKLLRLNRAGLANRCNLLTRLNNQPQLINRSSSALQTRTIASKAEVVKKAASYSYRGAILLLQLGVAGVLISAWLHNHPENQPLQPINTSPKDGRKRVIVLGTGWGATSLVKSLDPTEYEVVIVSPRNYFLFTPLLPSCTVGTLEHRSIMESIRYITRHKNNVGFVEGECTKIDPKTKSITIKDTSEIQGAINESQLNYDYLVVAVGSETATFNIPGVKENACFLKEIWDAKKIRSRLSNCIESASFSNQDPAEIERLLSMVVVGGGPTGVEYAAELHDFLDEDLTKWYPEIADKLKITLIEAGGNVLASFNKELITYTESTLRGNAIDIRTKSSVQGVTKTHVKIKKQDGSIEELPYGLLVWAAGNAARPVVRDLMSQYPEVQTARRGLAVDEHLRMKGADSIFVLGDAAASNYAPTAQVASQQGKYLAKVIDQLLTSEDQAQSMDKITPFEYSHNGSLAYIGSDKAIADLPIFGKHFTTGGAMTYLFWKSAYLSNLFSVRNASLVLIDWTKKFTFGRDISRE